MELEEVKEQDRVTVAPLITLMSAGAFTEIQHVLLNSTDTHRDISKDGFDGFNTQY